ncbi:MAG: di-trans,poly-cis-decaprenylcistransferase [Parcubacteria group bacterium]|jgi:undecaprenyl diphosphate synthase|nr:di-trans,poly-cis-decaprenylcistransferase [Parcubacteria group bacterium]|tara:strand:+ start:3021 stop:3740 length:720 start_codon:yes stop_codon:yes gene_type:complete
MNKENLPKHVAIVPDGNRRWAKKRGLNSWQGHLAGAKITEEIVKQAFDLGINCLSLWGGSWNNLTKRSQGEINGLFKIYERYFRKLTKSKEIYQNQVKVNVIGRWKEVLSKKTIKVIEELIDKTKIHNQRQLNFLIAYNGTDEMMAAIKSIVQEARQNKGLKIIPRLLESHLWSYDLPPVDLVIRTGSQGDPHNSVGFMMWQTANSQLYFTKTMYPDFKQKELMKAVEDFIKRQRRFGE